MRSIALLVALTVGLSAQAQGPLSPPGAPAPTMKTLDQVEPRIPISSLPTNLTASGSYYLTGNLVGVAGTNGITIQANGVTLDLSGYSLIGVPGSLDGIQGVSRLMLVVRNGIVRNWGGDGVDLSGNSQHVQVTDVVSATNGVDGIRVSSGGAVLRCNASQNGGSGIVGTGVGCQFLACVVNVNSNDGISAPTSSTILDCAARDNYRDGIAVQGGCVVRGCSSVANDRNGIRITGPGTVVEGCSATASGFEGILADKDSYLYGNNCDQNGGAGVAAAILVTNTGSRIDSNHAMGSDIGLKVVSPSNFVVRNTFGQSLGGTNYDLVAGNFVGGIVALTGSFTNSNPWANFEF